MYINMPGILFPSECMKSTGIAEKVFGRGAWCYWVKGHQIHQPYVYTDVTYLLSVVNR